MNTEMVVGVYGSESTPCDVIVCHDIDDCGGKWYTVKGSKNVNYTMMPIADGVNVERVPDEDCFTWSSEILNEAELVEAVES